MDSSLLQSSLRKLISEAITALSATSVPVTFRHYLAREGNIYTAHVLHEYAPSIQIWVNANLDLLRSLPSTSEFLNRLHEMIAATPHADTGAPVSRAFSDADLLYDVFRPLLMEFLDECILAHEGRGVFEEPNDEFLTACMAHITDYLSRPHYFFTDSKVILSGINVERPVVLEDGLVVRPMTHRERHRYHFDDDPFFNPTPSLTFGTRRDLADVCILAVSHEHFPNSQKIADAFVMLCRIVGIDRVRYVGIEQQSSNPIRRKNWTMAPPSFGGTTNPSLPESPTETVYELPAKWGKALAAWNDQSLRIALRRYSMSFSSDNFDDRVIDYWISLEALFGKDLKIEGTYRISLRIARLFQNDPEKRLDLQKQVKKSYNLRSNIVHGTSGVSTNTHFELIDFTKALVTDTIRLIVLEGWRPDYPRLDMVNNPRMS